MLLSLIHLKEQKRPPPIDLLESLMLEALDTDLHQILDTLHHLLRALNLEIIVLGLTIKLG